MKPVSRFVTVPPIGASLLERMAVDDDAVAVDIAFLTISANAGSFRLFKRMLHPAKRTSFMELSGSTMASAVSMSPQSHTRLRCSLSVSRLGMSKHFQA